MPETLPAHDMAAQSVSPVMAGPEGTRMMKEARSSHTARAFHAAQTGVRAGRLRRREWLEQQPRSLRAYVEKWKGTRWDASQDLLIPPPIDELVELDAFANLPRAQKKCALHPLQDCLLQNACPTGRHHCVFEAVSIAFVRDLQSGCATSRGTGDAQMPVSLLRRLRCLTSGPACVQEARVGSVQGGSALPCMIRGYLSALYKASESIALPRPGMQGKRCSGLCCSLPMLHCTCLVATVQTAACHT